MVSISKLIEVNEDEDIPREVRFSRRVFLNLEGSTNTGSIQLEITKSVGKYGVKSGYLEYQCMINDCSRNINLSFDDDTEDDRKDSLNKAKVLAEAFADYYDALKEAFKEAAELKAAKKKREAEEAAKDKEKDEDKKIEIVKDEK